MNEEQRVLAALADAGIPVPENEVAPLLGAAQMMWAMAASIRGIEAADDEDMCVVFTARPAP